jgi:hypothetical protein
LVFPERVETTLRFNELRRRALINKDAKVADARRRRNFHKASAHPCR